MGPPKKLRPLDGFFLEIALDVVVNVAYVLVVV